jgi:hypothetical protein
MTSRCISKDFTLPLQQLAATGDHDYAITLTDIGSGDASNYRSMKDFTERYRPTVNGELYKYASSQQVT